jgi:hypothetical protein
MKTKTLLLLCLLLGIGVTQLSAQNGKNGTGSVSVKEIWNAYYIDIPVNCNDQVIDRLSGTVTIHVINHYKNGDLLWSRQQFDGAVTSQSGEVFTVKDIFTWDLSNGLICSGHCNIKGSYGTHYILTYIYDGNTDTFSFVKAVCP